MFQITLKYFLSPLTFPPHIKKLPRLLSNINQDDIFVGLCSSVTLKVIPPPLIQKRVELRALANFREQHYFCLIFSVNKNFLKHFRIFGERKTKLVLEEEKSFFFRCFTFVGIFQKKLYFLFYFYFFHLIDFFCLFRFFFYICGYIYIHFLQRYSHYY